VRVVCPYTPNHLRRGTVESLRAQAPHTEFIDVSAAPDSYFELFKRLWTSQEDFLLVEHDLVLAPGTVAALEACPEPWCSCHIDVEYKLYHGEAFFQCNRWRREIMLARPNACEIPMSQRYWGTLDGYLLHGIALGRPAPLVKHPGGHNQPDDPNTIRRASDGPGVYKAHYHLDLPTSHLSPYLGASGNPAARKAWLEQHSLVQAESYELGVDADAILARFRPPAPIPIGDGVAALSE